ncbi:MAG: hypothetical protein BZ135_03085 [Methanosphaera sp. rholeuAM6]|nr:MAG: hypothetical protein BZ135_03085 [Methanosphaera sp. rholeuAM6]
MAQKNMILALLLSFLFYLGNAYNGLVKRGLVEFAVGIILIILEYGVSSFIGLFVFIWWIYVLYDTYSCTNAINNNQAIPKFLTQFDLE